ncbi:MAG: CRTAC1 family protein [Myxococcota bacterium]
MSIATLWLGMWGCAGDDGAPPPIVPDSGGSTGDTIVGAVPAQVAAGGWIWGAALVPGDLAAAVGERALEAHTETHVDGFGVWRLPADLPLGPAELRFTSDAGEEQRVPIEVGAPWMVDVAAQAGVTSVQDVAGWPSVCAQSLSGVGLADVDLDGDLDLLHANLQGPSQLWLNESVPGTIAFVAAPPGVLPPIDLVSAVSFADWDNDGDPDLFLGRRGANRLLRNDEVDGERVFVDVTAGSGLSAAAQRTTGGAWGDLDGDGDLDLYEVNHAWCMPGAPEDPALADHLYLNLGAGRFGEVTDRLSDARAQISGRYGFAALWLDYDRDGLQDLWVVNDFVPGGGASVLWHGLPGALADVTGPSGIAPLPDAQGKATNAMGTAVGDLNGDGLPDFAYSNIGQNFLVLSAGVGRWEDASAAWGIERTTLPWGLQSLTWGTHLLDLDNDGDLDLVFVGGPLNGQRPMPHALFENIGGAMVERTWSAGLASPGHSHASAQGDLDGDGWVDLVVSQWGGPLEVWHNRLATQRPGHWLAVELAGDGVAVNRDALGAVVALQRLDGSVATCWRQRPPSMASSGDPTCAFGLGADEGAVDVTVTWPDGAVDVVPVDGVDQRMRIVRAP